MLLVANDTDYSFVLGDLCVQISEFKLTKTDEVKDLVLKSELLILQVWVIISA